MSPQNNYGVTRRVAQPTGSNPQPKTFQELPTQEGALVEGLNKVQLRGVFAYPNLTYTSTGIPRLTAMVYVPFTNRDGERKRLGYPIQAWGELAESLSGLDEGAPILLNGSINVFSWRDTNTGQKRSKTDVKVAEYWPL